MPLDIQLFREDKGGDVKAVRESQRRRFAEEKTVDDVLELDRQWREASTQLDFANRDKKKIQVERRKKGKDLTDAEKAGFSAQQKEIKSRIETLKADKARLTRLRDEALATIGNLVHDSVPVSKSEEHNKVMTTWGDARQPVPTDLDHHILLYRIGGYEPLRGASVAGHRGYFLTGPGVMLNLALQKYGMAFLMNEENGYTGVQPPYFMNREVMAATAQLSQFDEELYHVTGEHMDIPKYLIATSEQPISAMHMKEWLRPSELPIKYAGISTCFRKEAGGHGRDVWGIFRVHQFEKIEQFVLCGPDDSWDWHERMLKTSEEFYQSLGLPYQVVAIVSKELNNAAAKKYDLEGWFPKRKQYKELVSCSNCTDYQSRAMETRFGQKQSGDREKKYVHMLNSTLCATTRTICCILENYQTEDGVRVPEALVPYCDSVDFFPFVRKYPKNMGKAKEFKPNPQTNSNPKKLLAKLEQHGIEIDELMNTDFNELKEFLGRH